VPLAHLEMGKDVGMKQWCIDALGGFTKVPLAHLGMGKDVGMKQWCIYAREGSP
jgi:hypothetical protein